MSGPRLTVLGSGTAVPLPDRTTSCYLLEDGGGAALLVDLGPGALARAAAAGVDLERLDGVLLTHVHPDHCADLIALQFGLSSPLIARERGPVQVFGHAAVARINAGLRATFSGWLEPGPGRFALHTVEPGPVTLPWPLQAEAHPIVHHESSLGWRLTLAGGAVVAFSGDAVEGLGLDDLAAGADVLVLEAAGPDGAPIPGHLTPRRAGVVAARAGVRHLVLTHFYPPTLAEPIEAAVRETFEGALTLAHDGLALDIPS